MFILVLILQMAWSQSQSNKVGFTKQEFLSKFSQQAKIVYCNENSLMGCFKMEENSCHESVNISATVCQKKLNIPQFVRFLANEDKVAESLGDCIGQEFYKMHFRKLKKGSLCDTRSK